MRRRINQKILYSKFKTGHLTKDILFLFYEKLQYSFCFCRKGEPSCRTEKKEETFPELQQN